VKPPPAWGANPVREERGALTRWRHKFMRRDGMNGLRSAQRKKFPIPCNLPSAIEQ
jgi:hypothetical protein